MHNLKFGVLLCGLLGIVAVFLPAEGHSVWNTRNDPFPGMPDGQAVQVYMVLAAWAVATIMGVMGVLKGMQRWMSIVALLAFGFVMFKAREFLPLKMFDHALPFKLGGIGMYGGVIFSIITLAKPEPAK